jgi:hypothetical protein
MHYARDAARLLMTWMGLMLSQGVTAEVAISIVCVLAFIFPALFL